MDKVLSIDPSINNIGFAFFYQSKLVEYDTRKTWKRSPTPPVPVRLKEAHSIITNFCELFEPDVIVIEDFQFRSNDLPWTCPNCKFKNPYGRNGDNLKKLVFSIGAVIASVPAQVEVVMIKPQKWKGPAKKKNTLKSVRDLFGVENVKDDTADAIMLGHFYLESQKQMRIV